MLFGPYRTPRCTVGKVLACEIRGDVLVTGISDGKIHWPQTNKQRGGRRYLIVCGDLAKAIRQEAAIAICHWWGVTGQTVSGWRKALGVPQGNKGTRQLHRDWFPELRDDEALERHQQSLKSPERAAKIAAALRGNPRPPEVMAKAHAANRGRKHTEESRRKMSEAQKRRGAYPTATRRPFTPEEDVLLGTMMDTDVAEQIGRDKKSAAKRRNGLGIASYRQRQGRMIAVCEAATKRLNERNKCPETISPALTHYLS